MEDYPVVKKIKTRMKNDNRISTSQVNEYKRRFERSDFLKVHVEFAQSSDDKRIKLQKQIKEKDKEIKHLETCLNIKESKGQVKFCLEFIKKEFGEKSNEYLKFISSFEETFPSSDFDVSEARDQQIYPSSMK